MGYAFDGSRYLVGLENRDRAPNGIGARFVSANDGVAGDFIDTGRTGIATAVAFDGSQFLLVWEDDALGTLTDRTGWQVFGQFVAPSGTRVGAPFLISQPGVWVDGIRYMAFGGGKYLVTYTRLLAPERGDQGDNRTIAGRLVGPDGTMGSELRISTGFGKASEVAFDGTRFLVVWCEDSADREIRGRFVSPSGALGAEITVNASPEPSDNPKAVVFDGATYLVVWNDEVGGPGTGSWDLLGQRVSTAGALVGDPVTVTRDPGPQLVTGVASDGVNCLVSWIDMRDDSNWDAWAQFLSPRGTPVGARIPLSTAPLNQMPWVGFDAGKYLIALAHGIVLGENGVQKIDFTEITLVDPLPLPRFLRNDVMGLRGSTFEFQVNGPAGQPVTLEATTASGPAASWKTLETRVLSGGDETFSDPDGIVAPTRLYRMRLR